MFQFVSVWIVALSGVSISLSLDSNSLVFRSVSVWTVALSGVSIFLDDSRKKRTELSATIWIFFVQCIVRLSN